MKTIIKTFILLSTIGLFHGRVIAQNSEKPNDNAKLSVEIDPATFIFNGYSLHLRFKPKSSEHLLLGAGIYAMDMPSVFVNINEKNRDMGWDVRLNRGIGIFGEYHFTEVNNKFFIGTQIGTQEYRIENENSEGSETFTNSLFMGYGGYKFNPFKFPLYIKVWGGLGYTSEISGNHVLEDREYDIAPIAFFATVHIGYTF